MSSRFQIKRMNTPTITQSLDLYHAHHKPNRKNKHETVRLLFWIVLGLATALALWHMRL